MRFLFIFLFICSGLAFGQNRAIDSLKKVIETTKVDTVKGRTLCRLCAYLRKAGDNDQAFKKGAEGLAHCRQVNDQSGEARCLNNIGNVYLSQGNYPKALEVYQKSLKINEQVGDDRHRAYGLNNIGIIYEFQGIYSKALEYYQKSLTIEEKMNNREGIASSLGNVGNIYGALHNYSRALAYYQKCYDMVRETGNRNLIWTSLNNIGLIYSHQRNFSQALEYYRKSLQIVEQTGDKNGMAAGYNNIGQIYHSKNEHEKALEYYQKSLIISNQIGDTAGISASLCSIGFNYLKMNQPQRAKEYAGKGLHLAQQIHHLEHMKTGADVCFQVDSALNDFQSAFEHHKLFKQYSDSLNNEDKAKEFGKIESKYEFEKQAETEKRAEQEKTKIEAAEKERRDNLQYLTIFAGIIGLFTGLLFIGKLKIPTKITEVFIFAGLLITFEFLLIFFDPYFEKYSGGIPFYKLGFNTLIAFGFAPLHSFLESKLKRRLVKGEKPLAEENTSV